MMTVMMGEIEKRFRVKGREEEVENESTGRKEGRNRREEEGELMK